MPKNSKPFGDFRHAKARGEYVPTKATPSFIEKYNASKGTMAVSLYAVEIFNFPTIAYYIIDAIYAMGVPRDISDFFSVESSEMKKYSIYMLNAFTFGSLRFYLTEFDKLFIEVTGKTFNSSKVSLYIDEYYLKNAPFIITKDNITAQFAVHVESVVCNQLDSLNVYKKDRKYWHLKTDYGLQVACQILLTPINKSLDPNYFATLRPHKIAVFMFTVPIIKRYGSDLIEPFAYWTQYSHFDYNILAEPDIKLTKFSNHVRKMAPLENSVVEKGRSKYELRNMRRIQERNELLQNTAADELFYDDAEELKNDILQELPDENVRLDREVEMEYTDNIGTGYIKQQEPPNLGTPIVRSNPFHEQNVGSKVRVNPFTPVRKDLLVRNQNGLELQNNIPEEEEDRSVSVKFVNSEEEVKEEQVREETKEEVKQKKQRGGKSRKRNQK